MAVGLGHKGAILGFGEESTWGTAVTPTNFICLTSDGLDKTIEKINGDCLNAIYKIVSNVENGNTVAAGDVEFLFRYEGAGLLLKHLMGAVNTTNPTGSVYNHVFTLADSLPVGLTFQKQADVSLTTGKGYNFIGGKVNTMSFSLEPNGFLTTTMGILAKDAVVLDSVTSAVLPTASLVTSSQAVINYSGSDISAKVSSMELTINNNLNDARRNLGSNTIYEPVRNGKIEVTGTMTVEYEDKTKFEDYINNTTKTLDITLTGTDIVASYPYYLKLDMDYVKIITYPPAQVTSEGIITVDLAFEAYADSSVNRNISIELQNTVATI